MTKLKIHFNILCLQILIVCSFFLPQLAFCQNNDNAEIAKMYQERNFAVPAYPRQMGLQNGDRENEQRILEMMKEGGILTANDNFFSGRILEFTMDSATSAVVVKLLKNAVDRSPSLDRYYLAAAIDRDLYLRNKPQIYGTLFCRSDSSKWTRCSMDESAISDEVRRYFSVPTILQQKETEKELNKLTIESFYNKSKSIDETIRFIKKEEKNRAESKYDLGEHAVNVFGYLLLENNELKAAQKVFLLNLELSPNSWNTHDSYAECLVKLGRKKEAILEYKKSLELNAGNKNAQLMLSELRN